MTDRLETEVIIDPLGGNAFDDAVGAWRSMAMSSSVSWAFESPTDEPIN